jgi:hypothetical protein
MLFQFRTRKASYPRVTLYHPLLHHRSTGRLLPPAPRTHFVVALRLHQLSCGSGGICFPSIVVVALEKSEMTRILDSEPTFSEVFTVHLLTRNSRVEEDLVDQLFNSSEKRLTRTLLLLANFGKKRGVGIRRDQD